MNSTNNKQEAFTIVELLIVIVVIGILAAISIVAYNGIQNRARNTAVADTAKQVRSKIETWNSIKGSYPTSTNFGTLTNGRLPANTAGLVDTDAKEAEIPGDIMNNVKVGTTAAVAADVNDHSGAHQVYVRTCANGALITYFEAGKTIADYPSLKAGAGC